MWETELGSFMKAANSLRRLSSPLVGFFHDVSVAGLCDKDLECLMAPLLQREAGGGAHVYSLCGEGVSGSC